MLWFIFGYLQAEIDDWIRKDNDTQKEVLKFTNDYTSHIYFSDDKNIGQTYTVVYTSSL